MSVIVEKTWKQDNSLQILSCCWCFFPTFSISFVSTLWKPCAVSDCLTQSVTHCCQLSPILTRQRQLCSPTSCLSLSPMYVITSRTGSWRPYKERADLMIVPVVTLPVLHSITVILGCSCVGRIPQTNGHLENTFGIILNIIKPTLWSKHWLNVTYWIIQTYCNKYVINMWIWRK